MPDFSFGRPGRPVVEPRIRSWPLAIALKPHESTLYCPDHRSSPGRVRYVLVGAAPAGPSTLSVIHIGTSLPRRRFAPAIRPTAPTGTSNCGFQDEISGLSDRVWLAAPETEQVEPRLQRQPHLRKYDPVVQEVDTVAGEVRTRSTCARTASRILSAAGCIRPIWQPTKTVRYIRGLPTTPEASSSLAMRSASRRACAKKRLKPRQR